MAPEREKIYRSPAIAGGRLAGALEGLLIQSELAGTSEIPARALRELLQAWDRNALAELSPDGHAGGLATLLDALAELPAAGYRKEHDAWVLIVRGGPEFMANAEMALTVTLARARLDDPSPAPAADGPRRETLERLREACETAALDA